ncbi:helix-turn-helix domain-containing protein [[Actinomadura] parvosata]|uniref:helix-turn-helix domain-containing protein n=1 Tax=[Actinomadura] parvosata TaxID=1955412 RepID=UPI00406C2EFF
MTSAVELPKMRKAKQIKFHAFRELWEAKENVPAIAQRLRVTERTVERYRRDLEGPRRIDYYAEWMPLVLEHLRRYPDSWFTDGELSRVLLNRDNVLRCTLQRMERERALPSAKGGT